ncbi:MAG: hypothetical protein IKZ90_07690 [Clostridiales bacterium]|nr:hypothetical protein [Clostridiales bacterium]
MKKKLSGVIATILTFALLLTSCASGSSSDKKKDDDKQKDDLNEDIVEVIDDYFKALSGMSFGKLSKYTETTKFSDLELSSDESDIYNEYLSRIKYKIFSADGKEKKGKGSVKLKLTYIDIPRLMLDLDEQCTADDILEALNGKKVKTLKENVELEMVYEDSWKIKDDTLIYNLLINGSYTDIHDALYPEDEPDVTTESTEEPTTTTTEEPTTTTTEEPTTTTTEEPTTTSTEEPATTTTEAPTTTTEEPATTTTKETTKATESTTTPSSRKSYNKGLSESEFTSKMESAGFTVMEETDEDAMKLLIAMHEGCYVSYYHFSSVDEAGEYYDESYEEISEYKEDGEFTGTITEKNGIAKGEGQFSDESDMEGLQATFVLIHADDTMIIILCQKGYESNLKAVSDALGYKF